MKILPSRRFHRIYEQLLLSRLFSLMLGWAVSVLLPFILYWGNKSVFVPTQGQKTAILVTTVAFFTAHYIVSKLYAVYPGGSMGSLIAPQVITVYALLALVVLLLRVEISRFLLVTCAFSALVWFHVEYFGTLRYRRLKLAVVGPGMTDDVLQLDKVDSRKIRDFELSGHRYDAVVADFDRLDEPTERFLTKCALNRLAVYDAKVVYESFSGRVKIHRMSENNIGSLLPTPMYERLKTLMDWSIIFFSLPIVLPLCLLTALCIRLESPGPIIYTQTRVGRGNKPFTIYKFRSMRFEQNASQKFADKGDLRVTKVGQVIRKLRIDELPQFFNILKGDMSLIGPRPEQPEFVRSFDEQIPFYSYRHVVKPGITGWAQVRQGYASNTDETRVKIEHDFYYIKNCSIYLDIVIAMLTVRTMLTGFGAR